MRVTHIITQIDVVGYIWQPGIGLCAYTYTPREGDLEDELGMVTRESVSAWLDTHSGDFSSIVDFRATVGDGTFDCDFADEDNEVAFNDAMYPQEDES